MYKLASDYVKKIFYLFGLTLLFYAQLAIEFVR